MLSRASRDSKLYPYADPWDGQRGPYFERNWLPDMLSGLGGVTDDYASLTDHLDGMDPHGVPPTDAAQLAANAMHVNGANPAVGPAWKSEQAFKNRSSKAIAALRQHIVSVPLVAEIDKMVRLYRGSQWAQGAPILTATYPATYHVVALQGQPLQGAHLVAYQQCGNSLARHVLARLKLDGMPRRVSGLDVANQNTVWANISLSNSVGIAQNTPTALKTYLEQVNSERNTPHPQNDVLVKFLQVLQGGPKEIATKAMDELASPRQDWRNADGTGSLALTVAGMQVYWEAFWQQGVITPKAAAAGASSYSTRVDGLSLSAGDDGSGADVCPTTDANEYNALLVQSRGGGSVIGEAMCWNCLGFGHVKNKEGKFVCPSPRRFRSLTSAVSVLQDKQVQLGQRGGRSSFGRGGGRGGRSGRGSQRPPPTAYSSSVEQDEGESDETPSDDKGDPAATEDCAETDFVGSLTQDAAEGEKEFAVSPGFSTVFTDNDSFVGYSLSADAEASSSALNYLQEVASFQLIWWHILGLVSAIFCSLPALLGGLIGYIAACVAEGLRKIVSPIGFGMRRLVRIGPFQALSIIIAILGIAYATKGQDAPDFTLTVFDLETSRSLARPDCNSCVAKIDTGATVTASGRKSLFPPSMVTNWSPNIVVRAANQSSTETSIMPVGFVGTLVYKPKNVPKKQVILIPGSFYVESLGSLTLVSPRQLFRSQNIKTFFNDVCVFVLPNGSRVPFTETEKGYEAEIDCNFCLDASSATVYEAANISPELTSQLIHERCCHFSNDRLSQSVDATRGLLRRIERHHCPACVKGGSKRPPARPRISQPSPSTGSRKFGDKVWSDTCSLPVSEPYGYIGWLAFLDDATRFLALYYIKQHTAEEINQCLKQFCIDNSDYLPTVGGVPSPKLWITDNHPGEFMSGSTAEFARELWMRHSTTVEWNPQRNPSERSHGIIKTCILKVAADAPNAKISLWPFIANQCVFVHNCLVTRSLHVIDPKKTPYEMRSGRKPDLSKLRKMFCKMVVTVRDQDPGRSKLDMPTVDATHLGLDHKRGGVYGYVAEWSRFTTFNFNDCTFYENEYLERIGLIQPHLRIEQILRRDGDTIPTTDRAGRRLARQPAIPGPVTVPAFSCVELNCAEPGFVPVIESDQGFMCLNLSALCSLPPPPKKVAELKGRPDEAEWRAALLKEYNAKKANGTWVLEERPTDAPVTKCKVVFSYKIDPKTGTLPDDGGHRCRDVACGYSQMFGENYWQTYTATTKASGLRWFAAQTALLDLESVHIDAEKFFTQSKLTETVYGEQMDGFVEGGYLPNGKPRLVRRFLKSIEGLKQSGHTAQTNNSAHLSGPCGLTQLDSEPTIFKRWQKVNGAQVLLLVLVWIDDMWASFTRGYYKSVLLPFYNKYKERFPARLFGEPRHFVGLSISRNLADKTISLSQSKYIESMVRKFVPEETLNRTVTLPASRLGKTDPYHALLQDWLANPDAPVTTKPFLSALMSTMYATCLTLPSCAFHTSFLSRFSHRPTDACWDALVTVMTFMYQNRNLHVLTYGGPIKIPDAPCKPPLNPDVISALDGLMIWSDASWKVELNYAGFVIFFANAAIDWQSKLLKVMLSSAEAEVGAGALACKRAIYLRHLIGEVTPLPALPIPHIVDHSALPPLSENLGVSRKTEHFRRWLHFMRYCVLHNYTYVHLTKSEHMLADSLTKVGGKYGYHSFLKAVFNIASFK